MRILLSAFACEPAQGSEAGIGWGIASSLAREHRVHVVTTPRHRAAIERFLGEQPCAALSFSYFDFDDKFLRWVRTSAQWQIYYHCWQLRVARWAAPVVDRFNPDLVHHVTYGRYWSPSSLWKIGRPFIWGPVGGGDTTPDAFVASYSARGKRLEKARRVARFLGEQAPSVKATARHAACGFATTPETAQRMERLGTPRVALSAHAALAAAELPQLAAAAGAAGPARFCCVGNLLHWKGFHLGLEAFAAAKLRDAELVVAGDGPERAELGRLAERLGIAGRVKFTGRLPRAQVLELMDGSTALLHPSLHDSGGFVCLEAMARRRPVVCLDLGGPGLMVTPATGYSIKATQPAQAIAELAAALQRLAGEPALADTLGAAGRERVESHFLWEQKTRQFAAVYREILTPNRAPSAAGVAQNAR